MFISYSGLLGGGERILVDLAASLDHLSPVIACPDGELAEAARRRGVEVLPLRGRRLEFRATIRDRVGKPLRLAGQALEVRELASALRPRVLVGWGTRAALECALALHAIDPRPAFVFQNNDVGPTPLVSRLARVAARRADLVVSLSATIARDLDPDATFEDRGVVVPPGVEIDAFAEIPPVDGPPSALVIGALVGWKRPHLALEAVALAARELPDLTMTVAGPVIDESGERLADALRRRAAEPDLAGRVHFAGALADPRPALAEASCLLHCADCEPYGMVLVEALASGRPVVAPAACGPAEIVAPECGRLFVPGDAHSAADALVALLGTPGLPARVGEAGRRRAERMYRLELSSRRWAELVEEAAARSGGAAAYRRRPRADRAGAPAEGLVAATVAIDARAAARREIGGVERLAQEMARRLPELRPERYRVLRPESSREHRRGHLWEQASLPLAARAASLIYCPANLAPLASTRTVVVLHDAAALRHPEWYSRTYAAYQRQLLPRIARRACKVVTVSEFSRGELVAALGIDPAAVAVIPGGVDPVRFSPRADPVPARTAHGLDRPYALVLGTRIARKNVAALRSVRRRLEDLGIELVLAGGGRSYMRADDDPPGRLLGYVDDALLPGLYAGAEALLMPSLYEGFGLPCLEAMACGTPVVAADRGALPEIYGESALIADPDDADAFADAALTVVSPSARRVELVAAGLRLASELTWDRTARATDALVDRLLAQSSES